jgi:hypothetical protein
MGLADAVRQEWAATNESTWIHICDVISIQRGALVYFETWLCLRFGALALVYLLRYAFLRALKRNAILHFKESNLAMPESIGAPPG